MKSRTRLAALQILALRENFNAREIRDALTLAGDWSKVIDSKSKKLRTTLGAEEARRPALTESTSRAVKMLKEQDPERYLILSEIDQAIRHANILPTMSDIKRAGILLDKSFDSGKSKQVAIPRLLEMLSEFPIIKLKRIFDTWKYETKNDLMHNTEYDDLAEFLLKGTEYKQKHR